MKEAFAAYRQIIEQENYADDYQYLKEKLGATNAYYQGEVIPFLYQPFFFSKAEWANLQSLVDNLNRILDKVIDRYLEEPEFRNYFNFSEPLEELILTDPGYSCNLPMARFDIFYYPEKGVKFCELNTDGSSGMAKTNILERNFLQAEAVKKMKTEYEVDYLEMVNSWIDKLLANYREFAGSKQSPNIAIMDFTGYGMNGEFKEFRQEMENRGLAVKIVDPRDLEYRAGKLYAEDFAIDLIYRRAVTTDLMDHYSEISDFLTAYREQAVCVVGSFRSQVVHNKLVFAILHDEDKVDFLTEQEKKFIKQTVPETAEVDPTDKEQLNYIKNNRKQLVLKPKDDYGSSGVVIGPDVSQQKWEAKLKGIEGDNYLVQEFLKLPSKQLVEFTSGKAQFREYKYILGLFSYNQQLAGIYTRADKQNVIASCTGCVTLPNFIVGRENS